MPSKNFIFLLDERNTMTRGKSEQYFTIDRVYFWRFLPQGVFSICPQYIQ